MIEHLAVVGPFQCNCRLLVCEQTGEAALVDPGDEAERILKRVRGTKLKSGAPVQVKWLLHTHGHLDHVGAARAVKQAIPESRIALHSGDEPLYLALKKQGQMFGIQYDDPPPIDHRLEHGEEIIVGKLKFSVIHTPGHSPGSVCLRMHEDSASGVKETLFSGDTLFYRSVGRTDLWGADGDLMFKNINDRILTLDGDTRVCPGHGPDTRVGDEKRENPFL